MKSVSHVFSIFADIRAKAIFLSAGNNRERIRAALTGEVIKLHHEHWLHVSATELLREQGQATSTHPCQKPVYL